VHCGGRVDEWCCVLRDVLQLDDVGLIGHFSGSASVFAFSPIAGVVSSGLDDHEFWALAPDARENWLRFAASLESALVAAGLQYSLTVHEVVLVLE
jgi:hypothetical protein